MLLPQVLFTAVARVEVGVEKDGAAMAKAGVAMAKAGVAMVKAEVKVARAEEVEPNYLIPVPLCRRC